MVKSSKKSSPRFRGPLLALLAGLTVMGVGKLTAKALSPRETEVDCEVYQGYTADNADGYNLLVFDPETKNSRMYRPARFPLRSTNSNLTDSLQIGQRYCFEHTPQRYEGSVADLVSMRPVTE